jgi:multicomponent Na+:H+ antiporter subunit A
MAGMPPLFGFISKELTYESALEFGPWLTGAVVLTGLFFVFVAGSCRRGTVLGEQETDPKVPA